MPTPSANIKQYTIIRRAAGDIQFRTYVNINSYVRFELMKEHYIQLNFSTKEKIYFSVGDYCVTEYGVFEITKNYVPTYNRATAGYDYQLRMDAQYWKWNNKLLFFQPLTQRFETSWSLTDTIDKHLAILQNNLQYHNFRHTDNAFFTFAIDNSLLGTAKLVVYESTRIIDALNQICEEFECEWWVDGSVVHVGRCEHGTAVEFQLEREVKQMTGASSEGTHATRIYPFGSTRNVPKNYRSNDENVVLNGVVQKRVMLPSSYAHPYIQIGDIDAEEEAIEAVAIFDEVYPHTDGTMTTVTFDNRQVDDGEGGKETVKIYRFKDSGFTFRSRYILPKTDLQIVIQSGIMRGMTFDVKFNPDNKAEEINGQINDEAQVFEIVRNDTYGPMLPNDDINPTIDEDVKYRLIGWDTEYMQELGLLDAAEEELAEEAQRYVEKLQIDDSTYTCTMMSDYMFGLSPLGQLDSSLAKSFDVGQRVTLINDNFFKGGSRNSRIIGYQYKLDFKYDEAQYIVGENSKYSRLNDLEGKIDALNYRSDVHLYEAGTGVYIIKTSDTTPASEYNVFSAKRSLAQFLRKDVDDVAQGRIDFRQRTKHVGGVQFGANYAGGITGFGGVIDGDGRGELRSLTLWEWLQVPELRYNRISIQVGNRWRAPGGGIILAADPDLNLDGTPSDTGTIELHLEEGEIGKIAVDDICMGIFHDGMTLANNDADDFDDSKGNFRFSGFFTVYFTVTRILESGKNSRFKYRLRNDAHWNRALHPCAMMHFVSYGNFTDPERQSSRYSTLTYERYLHNVNTWEYSVQNIGAQFGDLSNLSVYNLDMSGYSAYLNNIYMSGHLEQIADVIEDVSQYNIDFSDYVDVITVDDTGNVIGGLYKIDNNNNKYDYRIHSAIQVRKNSELLLWAEDNNAAGDGTYKIYAEAVGCTCSLRNSTLYITGIANCKDGVAGSGDDVNFDYDAMRSMDNCYVNLTIDCEGKTTIVKKFPVTIKHDAQPFVSADIDNESSAVSWNTKLQRYVGLPIVMHMKMWHNNEYLDIASVNDISVTNTVGATIDKAIETVVVNAGQANEYSYKQARVRITALPADAPLVSNFDVTCVASYAGVRYERTKVHTLNKSTDTNVYQLLPSLPTVGISWNNLKQRVIETDKLYCQVTCDSSDDNHYIVAPADFTTHNLKLKYKIVRENGTETSEMNYTTAGVSIATTDKKVLFFLYLVDSEGTVLETLDSEGVDIILDGIDGDNAVHLAIDNENDNVLCLEDGTVLDFTLPTTKAYLWDGDTQVPKATLNAQNSWLTLVCTGCTAQYDNTGDGYDTDGGRKIKVTAVTDVSASVLIRCQYTSKGVTQTHSALLSIKKDVGTDKYEIITNPASVCYNPNTDSFNPETVEVAIYKTTRDTARSLLRVADFDATKLALTYSADGGTTWHNFTYGNNITKTMMDVDGVDSIQVKLEEKFIKNGTSQWILRDIESVDIVGDGIDPIVCDLANEHASVSWSTLLNQWIGLPVQSALRIWAGSEQLLPLTNLTLTVNGNAMTKAAVTGQSNQYSYTYSGSTWGVTVVANYATGALNVTALTGEVPRELSFVASGTASRAGTPYTRSATLSVTTSKDLNVYELKTSVSEVVRSYSNGSQVVDVNTVTCSIQCSSTDGGTYTLTAAQMSARNLAIKHRVFTGGMAGNWQASASASIAATTSKVEFALYDNDVETDEKETVPVLADGADGKGVEYVFFVVSDWDGVEAHKPTIYDVAADRQVDNYCPYTDAGHTDQWTDEPTGVGINNKYEFYAQRKKVNGVWQPFGTVKLWDHYAVDGTSPYMLDLSNENSFINCDESGNVIGSYESTRIMLFKGSADAWSMFNVVITANNISYTTSQDGKTITPSNITANSASITVTATHKTDSNIVLTAVYKINKALQGESGVIYSLEPLIDVIHKDGKGAFIDTTLQVNVKKVVGGTTTLLDTYTKINNEGLALKYLKGAGTTQQDFPSSSNVVSTSDATDSGTYLYTTILLIKNSVVIDKERINCVEDGNTTPVYFIEANPESVTIPKDATQATYQGYINLYKQEGDVISPYQAYTRIFVRQKDGTRRTAVSGGYVYGYGDQNQNTPISFNVNVNDDTIEVYARDTAISNTIFDDYVIKKEIAIYKDGDTGPQGEDADFHEIIARGTHYNSEVYPRIEIDGQSISLSYSRGLTLTVLNANLTVYHQANYDVYNDPDNTTLPNTTNPSKTYYTDQLISALTTHANENRIAIITSYDAIYIHDRLWARLAVEYGVGVDIRTVQKRRALAIICQKGMKPGQALVSWTDLEDYARVRTSVANGVVCVYGKDVPAIGENLLRGTDFKLANSKWLKYTGTVIENDYEGCNAYLITQPNSDFIDPLEQLLSSSTSGVLKNSTWYTLSFYGRGGTIRTHLYPSIIDTTEKCFVDGVAYTPNSDGQRDWALDEVYKLHTYTFKTKAKYDNTHIFAADEKVLWRKYYNTGGNVYLSKIKLEEGVYATQWQTKQEDRKGLNGCHERLFEVFTPYQTYYNEENDEKLGIRYVDFLAIEDNSMASGYKVYQCVDTHVAAATFSQDSSHWVEVSINAASAFFTFLIAKNANIKMLSSSQIVIAETNGTVVAGLANAENPLWVGGSDPATAPFHVNRAGYIYATRGFVGAWVMKEDVLISQIGKISSAVSSDYENSNFIPHIALDAINGEIRAGDTMRLTNDGLLLYNGSRLCGKIVNQYISNEIDTDAAIIGLTTLTESSTQSIYFPTSGGFSSTAYWIVRKDLGYFYNGSEIRVKNARFTFTLPTAPNRTIHWISPYTLKVYLKCGNHSIVVQSQSLTPGQTVDITLTFDSTYNIDGSTNPEGRYWLYYEITAAFATENNTQGVSGTSNSATLYIRDAQYSYTKSVEKLCLIGQNGFFNRQGTDTYILSTEYGFKAQKGTYILEVSSYGIRVSKDSGANWTKLIN